MAARISSARRERIPVVSQAVGHVEGVDAEVAEPLSGCSPPIRWRRPAPSHRQIGTSLPLRPSVTHSTIPGVSVAITGRSGEVVGDHPGLLVRGDRYDHQVLLLKHLEKRFAVVDAANLQLDRAVEIRLASMHWSRRGPLP